MHRTQKRESNRENSVNGHHTQVRKPKFWGLASASQTKRRSPEVRICDISEGLRKICAETWFVFFTYHVIFIKLIPPVFGSSESGNRKPISGVQDELSMLKGFFSIENNWHLNF